MTDAPASPPIPLTPEEESQALAAEYALGLLEDAELEAAQARVATDPDFAAMVREWHERLASLADELTLVMAPARAKVMIDRALGHTQIPELQSEPRSPGGLMRWFWGAIAAAAVVATIIVVPPMLRDDIPAGFQPEFATDIVAGDVGLQVHAGIDADDRTMVVVLEEGSIPEGRDYEIWWLESETAEPVSLGLLPRSGTISFPMPTGTEPQAGPVIALTDEPEGGSPTGLPTGPVIGSAALVPVS
ncbi:anti-sigma factor [Paracoccus sp. TK19116]|uniref:Anti-sigma factor n=1 Tax=Paracoccus albicereus TaxID=2922394 RepID=A0ABT1MU38_9RHOB|nr:anti-sigma factor [Paracoccus albicereus]MCQ0971194.1 anti-sigma factor [Paracoccus albicereus]